MAVGKLTGPKKAAILLLALGEEGAAEVMKNLEEAEFNGFDKNSNVDDERRKKERRMSAIRALNAKRQAARQTKR